MSLSEEWYAARLQRQQEVLDRKKQVTFFLEQMRSYHQQIWREQAQERSDRVAAIRNYVWGTTPTSENSTNKSDQSNHPQ